MSNETQRCTPRRPRSRSSSDGERVRVVMHIKAPRCTVRRRPRWLVMHATVLPVPRHRYQYRYRKMYVNLSQIQSSHHANVQRGGDGRYHASQHVTLVRGSPLTSLPVPQRLRGLGDALEPRLCARRRLGAQEVGGAPHLLEPGAVAPQYFVTRTGGTQVNLSQKGAHTPGGGGAPHLVVGAHVEPLRPLGRRRHRGQVAQRQL
eukprot:COSAG01_NODE_8764_length_2666_cov_6.455006_5_plen_204_part_00